jgi:hypothetical protein
VGHNQGNSTCVLTKNATTGVIEGEFHKNQDCDSYEDIDAASGNETFTKTLNIYYNDVFFDDNDLALNVSCFYTNNATTSTGIASIAGEGQQITEVESAYEPARLGVMTNPGMAAITAPVNLGDRIFLFNYLDDIVLFKKMYVDECIANDPVMSKSVTIIQGGCPTDKAKKLFFSQATGVTSPNTGITHDIKVFKLDANTTTLTITCDVVMCRDASSSACADATCSGFTPMSRRKRSVPLVGVNDVQQQQVQASMQIENGQLQEVDEENDMNNLQGNATVRTPPENGASGIHSFVVSTVLATSVTAFFVFH